MKKELISMVDFVLGRENWLDVYYYGEGVIILNYANFLNTPLNISMFVPAIKVGDKWEVLEEPPHYMAILELETRKDVIKNSYGNIYKYQTAKDKTLFTGFDSVRFVNDIIIIKHGSYVGKFHVSCKIEMLIGLKFLKLTNNGQKESGYK